MATNKIDAGLFAKMFLAGAKNLEVKKEWINELNVFPVPDGDTGTNMTLTIMSAVKEVNSLAEPNMYNLAKAISSGSLRGARGNSGVILSQLLRGFTKVIRDYDEIDALVLAAAMEKAVETAYKAVMKPKEGTILTVAKGAAAKAAELAMDCEDLGNFIEDVVAHAKYVLSQTPEMLPVLKEAGVVDSGGQGLMQAMKGAFDGFLGKEISFAMDAAASELYLEKENAYYFPGESSMKGEKVIRTAEEMVEYYEKLAGEVRRASLETQTPVEIAEDSVKLGRACVVSHKTAVAAILKK